MTSQSAQEKSKQRGSAKGRRLSILFADDQEEIRALTTHQLACRGHKVLAVANGKEAIKALQRGGFDVVLLDEEMPGMSGVEVARAIRERASGSNKAPLLVAVTANTTSHDRERLLAAGFDEVMGKPLHMEAFDVILDVLVAKDFPLASTRKVEAPEEDPIKELSQRVNGDRKLTRKMIQTFLRGLPSRMNSLRQALRRSDAYELAAQAHALKGTVSIFGASEARARSQELQDLGRNGDVQPAHHVYELLKKDIAKLQKQLKGHMERP